ncbi:MAG: hypothetical protein V9H69_20765 [Anaerolineae bacterium]
MGSTVVCGAADLAQRQNGRAIQPDPGEDVIQQGGQGEVQRAVVEGVAVDGGRRAAAAELAVGLEELDLDPGARAAARPRPVRPRPRR